MFWALSIIAAVNLAMCPLFIKQKKYDSAGQCAVVGLVMIVFIWMAYS